jgi:2-dehydropantoate 2-reductase
MTSPIYILGAGSIGCLWAAALHFEGRAFELLLQSQSKLDLVKEQGIAFTPFQSHKPDVFFPKCALASSSTEIKQTVLVTTKAKDALPALKSIHKTLHPNAHLFLFQNGLGFHEKIASAFPDCSIYYAITTEGAYSTAPFNIIHAGRGLTKIGLFKSNNKPPIAPDVSFYNKVLPIEFSNNIAEVVWNKFLINCAINAYTVLYNVKNGDLLTLPNAISNINTCCEELARISHIIGLPVSPSELFEKISSVLHSTRHNKSSMLQDIHNGKQTEIDYLNGYIVELSLKHHVSTPENSRIYNAIKQYEAGI